MALLQHVVCFPLPPIPTPAAGFTASIQGQGPFGFPWLIPGAHHSQHRGVVWRAGTVVPRARGGNAPLLLGCQVSGSPKRWHCLSAPAQGPGWTAGGLGRHCAKPPSSVCPSHLTFQMFLASQGPHGCARSPGHVYWAAAWGSLGSSIVIFTLPQMPWGTVEVSPQAQAMANGICDA